MQKPDIIVKVRGTTDENCSKIREDIDELIMTFSDSNLFPRNIVSICVTDNFQNDVKEMSEEWGIRYVLTMEREFQACSKYISRIIGGKIEVKLIIDFLSCHRAGFLPIICGTILNLYYEECLPSELQESEPSDVTAPPGVILKHFCKIWFPQILAKEQERKLIPTQPFTKHEITGYVNFLMRRIKRMHWEYQATSDLRALWATFIEVFGIFVSRCNEIDDLGTFKDEFGGFYESAKAIKDKLAQMASAMIRHEIIQYSDLVPLYYKFASCCYLDASYDGAWNVRITENPKTIYRDRCLDTETRIVAFSDILGFSKMIETYDADSKSNLLIDVKSALDQAVSSSLRLFQNNKYLETFEYRQFSDCLSLSIPFFDVDEDFILQLAVVLTTLSTYQLTLLNSGIVVRGGVCIGSYYSDSNMIFSGGLVRASKTDKHGNPPCLIIDESLYERILKCDKNKLMQNGIIHLLAMDTSTDRIFINPFGILNPEYKTMDRMVSSIDSIKHDLSENTEDEAIKTLLESSKTLWLSMFIKIKQDGQKGFQEALNLLIKWVASQLEKYRNDYSVRVKYIWLRNYLGWVSGEDKSHFDDLANRIGNR